MDVQWVKIRAWHAVKSPSFSEGHTLCGRDCERPFFDDLPAEKSCESCLRIVARLADA